MTDESSIPARVRDLLSASIHSIEELEILLFLRSAAGHSRSAAQLSRELRLPEGLAETAVQALVSRKLALQVGDESPRRYQYGPHTPELEVIITELAATYGQSRLEVLMQLSSNAIERVRKGVLTKFSDAFRLPSRRKDDG